jgi:hypothetical protein
LLLSKYIQLQITTLYEEYDIWTEVCRVYIVMNNRRPESNSSLGSSSGGGVSNSIVRGGDGVVGGGKTIMTDDSGSGSNSIMKIVNNVRTNVLYNKWNKESSNTLSTTVTDGTNYTTLLIENISPNLIALRDALIMIGQLDNDKSIIDSSSGNAISVMNDCYISLTRAIERLMDIVSVISSVCKDGGDGSNSKVNITILWDAIVFFLTPLMTNYIHDRVIVVIERDEGGEKTTPSRSSSSNNNSVSNLDITFRKLVECCSMTIITYGWLFDPSFVDVAPPPPTICSSSSSTDANNNQLLLSMANSCLLVCEKLSKEEDEKVTVEKKEDKRLAVGGGKKMTSIIDNTTLSTTSVVLTSKGRYSDSEKFDLLCFRYALAASTCRTDHMNIINNEGSDSSSSEYIHDALLTLARKSTIAAISILKSNNNNLNNNPNAKFGTMYVHFLSVWMGMYYTPWPMCTIDQARSILRNARDAITTAQKNWSRQDHDIEQVLLNAGEADLEGCLIGGSTVLSEKLYRATLTILDETVAIETIMANLLRVHCLLGLARLLIVRNDPGDDNVIAAEEWARDALNTLSSINPNQLSVLSGMSHAYHVCTSRQLIADACIRSGRPEDAGSFLSEAVRGKFCVFIMFLILPTMANFRPLLIHNRLSSRF